MAETPTQRRRRVTKEHRELAKASSGGKQRSQRRTAITRNVQRVMAVLLVAATVGSVWFLVGRDRREAVARLGDLVVAERSLGRNHLASTTTDPAPTSGPHSGGAVCGIYHRALGADTQIHSLEHGAVLFQYREADLSEDQIEALGQVAREFGSHVTVAPNPALPEPFVATAWLKRMELPTPDLDRARDFAIAFRERGPERVDRDV